MSQRSHQRQFFTQSFLLIYFCRFVDISAESAFQYTEKQIPLSLSLSECMISCYAEAPVLFVVDKNQLKGARIDFAFSEVESRLKL